MQLKKFSAIIVIFFPLLIVTQDLNPHLSSILANPTFISAFQPVATNSALLSTLASYIQMLKTKETPPTEPPAFATALPTEAQDLVSSAFALENSIISEYNATSTTVGGTHMGSVSITTAPASTTSSTQTIFGTPAITPMASVLTGCAAKHYQVASMVVVAGFLFRLAAALLAFIW